MKPSSDLGALSAGFGSGGNGINSAGQVVGNSNLGTPSFASHAYRTGPNAAIVAATDDLGTLIGSAANSGGFAINDSGQVVGQSDAGAGAHHAFRSDPNPSKTLHDLGSLGGTNSIPHSINSAGQVVGNSTLSVGFNTHAFRTGPSAAINPLTDDLGTLGGSFSTANTINSSGQVVGYASITGDTASHAFLYTGGIMYDLNNLTSPGSGWVLTAAFGINDLGQISGGGFHNGQFAPFRADPVNTAVSNLITQLSSPALGLTNGEINSLSATLDAALKSIQKGSSNPAANQLGAFINQVQADAKTGKISAANAAQLIATANAIIASL